MIKLGGVALKTGTGGAHAVTYGTRVSMQSDT